MKWTKTPQGLIVDSHCEASDGTNLGWVNDIHDECAAYIFNGYKSASYLGSFKTTRLAQVAVERGLLKRWFRHEWDTCNNKTYALWVGGYYLFDATVDRKEKNCYPSTCQT